MRKDIQNVAITFSLIGIMLSGGSYFYTKKVHAVEEAQRALEIQQLRELESQQAIQQEFLKKQEESTLVEAPVVSVFEEIPTTTPTATPAQKDTTFAAAIQKQQAELLAKEKAAALAKQKADQLAAKQIADALAQKIADQKAVVAMKAAQKASRRSRAS